MTLTAITASDLAQKIQALYSAGLPKGNSTGWACVDEYYTVGLGQWTVVTGVPGHGKSEWLDALMSNLSLDGWRFVVFSPENQPHELHAVKLMEKLCRKPFGFGPMARMDAEEIAIATGMLDMAFRFLTVNAEFVKVPSLVEVLTSASVVLQQWIDEGETKLGLVIDPWNEMDHGIDKGESETQYISRALSTIRQFARDWNIHVWVVAHPTKIYKDKEGKYPVPTMYDISGSAHWRNKADNGICIHRDVMNGGMVDIHIQKIRFKNIGRPGLVSLFYDRHTGCYSESAMEAF